MSKFGKLLGYDPEAKKTNVKTEIIAGFVTFLTMCYILTVNPDQITSFAPRGALWSTIFISTALGAVIGTLLMAFLAKMPLAQASGMGLNSLLGTVIGGVYGQKKRVQLVVSSSEKIKNGDMVICRADSNAARLMLWNESEMLNSTVHKVLCMF